MSGSKLKYDAGRIIELAQSGMGTADIALTMSCGEATARRILSQNGIDDATRRAYMDSPDSDANKMAHQRSFGLRAIIEDMMTEHTRYPVINTEDLIVEARVRTRIDRKTKKPVLVDMAPRTWLRDHLYVAPVEKYKNTKWIFTGAQNDAEIDRDFWLNLKAYARYIGAEIVVGTWTYETAWFNESGNVGREYDPALAEHLCFGRMDIGPMFAFHAEQNILPTAGRPIRDLPGYSKGKWAVYAHAKRQLQTIASLDEGVQAAQMMSTGAITRPKVIPRKAGIVGIHHHVMGATLVEFDGAGDIFTRQITANKNGSFHDLNCFIKAGRVLFTAPEESFVRVIVMPDAHVRKMRPVNLNSLYGVSLKDWSRTGAFNLYDAMRPGQLCAHDIFDNETRSHHHIFDNAYRYRIAYMGRDLVAGEVYDVHQYLRGIRRDWCLINVIESNHDLGLTKYINQARYLGDGMNTKFGARLFVSLLESEERAADSLMAYASPKPFSLLEYAVRGFGPLPGVKWRYDGKSFLIGGVEHGHHLFRGKNGTKGTPEGFTKMGRRITGADKHDPCILDGLYIAGTQEIAHGYNKGPSGWCVTPSLQYRDGKRTLITLQNGKFMAPPNRRSSAACKRDYRAMIRRCDVDGLKLAA